MKQMKVMMIAMMAILGITFTSCLDSDPDYKRTAYVTIDYNNVMTVDGTGQRLVTQNPSAMYLKDGSIPERALVLYEVIDGEDESADKINVNFIQYYEELYPAYISGTPIDGVSPFLGISKYPWSWDGYLNVVTRYYTHDDDDDSDFKIYVDKVENNTLYYKIVNTAEIEKGAYYSQRTMSYYLPSEYDINEMYPELTADQDGYYSVIVTADCYEEYSTGTIEFKSEKIKVKFPAY